MGIRDIVWCIAILFHWKQSSPWQFLFSVAISAQNFNVFSIVSRIPSCGREKAILQEWV